MSEESSGIKASLAKAGIPDAAITTTLPLMGREDIRSYIAKRGYIGETGLQGYYVYPQVVGDTAKARKVFYVTAKEMMLSGVQVYCIPLVRLVQRLTDDSGDSDTDYELNFIESSQMLFVLDFYEREVPFPLSPWQAAVVRNWIKERIESKLAVSLLGDKRLEDCSDWWPSPFLNQLGLGLTTFVVGGRK